jgi:hypothetical protein
MRVVRILRYAKVNKKFTDSSTDDLSPYENNLILQINTSLVYDVCSSLGVFELCTSIGFLN